MRKIIVISSLTLLAAIAFMASCSTQASRRTHQLGQIAPGDSEDSVLARLGQPRVRERVDQPYLVYASRACAAPCTVRLWWEWPLFRGIEAWSVELDASHQVIRTTHWVSP